MKQKSRSNGEISKKNFKRGGGDTYFPIYNIKPAPEFALKTEYYNLDVIGSKKLNAFGLDGDGIKIAVIDSGCIQSVYMLKDFTGEGDNDKNGHGTHVVSIIRSIAPKAHIYMAKAMDKTGGGDIENLIEATKWAKDMGCHLVNCSFAFNPKAQVSKYQAIIDECVKAGMVFCCASGNEGNKEASFPSNKDNVFCVGAIDRWLTITDFSNKGADVDLVAPGDDILGDSIKGGQIMMSGTSQAAPHVLGMIALYFQHSGIKNFFDTHSYITKRSVKDLGQKGHDINYGYGLIKPYFAGILDDAPVRKKKWWEWLFS